MKKADSKQKLATVQLIVEPLHNASTPALRRAALEAIKYAVTTADEASRKFVVGGLFLAVEKKAKSLLSTANCRMSCLESLVWIKVLTELCSACGSFLSPEVAKKAAAIGSKLATCSATYSKADFFDKRVREFLAIKAIKEAALEDSSAVVLHAWIYKTEELKELKTSVLKSVNDIFQEKAKSTRGDLQKLEYISTVLQVEDVKELVPTMKKMMLRSPEVCCPRIHAIVVGFKNDFSELAADLQEPLLKCLVGMDVENVKNSAVALQRIYERSPSAPAKVVEHIRKVWNGKEGKITSNGQKVEILKLFGYFVNATEDTRVAAITNLVLSAEKEITDETLVVVANSLAVLSEETKNENVHKEGVLKLNEGIFRGAK